MMMQDITKNQTSERMRNKEKQRGKSSSSMMDLRFALWKCAEHIHMRSFALESAITSKAGGTDLRTGMSGLCDTGWFIDEAVCLHFKQV